MISTGAARAKFRATPVFPTAVGPVRMTIFSRGVETILRIDLEEFVPHSGVHADNSMDFHIQKADQPRPRLQWVRADRPHELLSGRLHWPISQKAARQLWLLHFLN